MCSTVFLAAVHAQARRESPPPSARIAGAFKRSGGPANRSTENDRHRRRDFFDLVPRDAPCTARRPHVRAKQNLGGVDIAYTGDDSLIHYQVLNRRGPS